MRPVWSDQSSHCGIADGEGWPRLIAEGAGGKCALTKQVANVIWRARRCALFNFAILREIKNGDGTGGFWFIGPTPSFCERTIVGRGERGGGFYEHVRQAVHRVTKNSNSSLMALWIHQMCLSELAWHQGVVSDDVRSETTEPCFGLGIGAAGGEQRRVYMKNGIGDNSSTENVRVCQTSLWRGWLKQKWNSTRWPPASVSLCGGWSEWVFLVHVNVSQIEKSLPFLHGETSVPKFWSSSLSPSDLEKHPLWRNVLMHCLPMHSGSLGAVWFHLIRTDPLSAKQDRNSNFVGKQLGQHLESNCSSSCCWHLNSSWQAPQTRYMSCLSSAVNAKSQSVAALVFALEKLCSTFAYVKFMNEGVRIKRDTILLNFKISWKCWDGLSAEDREKSLDITTRKQANLELWHRNHCPVNEFHL